MTAVELEKFRYRFRRPFQNGVRSYSEREGVRLVVRHAAGVFTGEAAPLPGHSSEMAVEAESALQSSLDGVRALADSRAEATEILKKLEQAVPASPSGRFAAGTALLNLRAAQTAIPVARLLAPAPCPSVTINAVVTAGPGDAMKREIDRAVLDGIRCLKIKLGPDLEANRRKVSFVRGQLPAETLLRGDANGGWSYETARAQLAMLLDFGIEYVEQPLPSDSTPEMFARLRASSPVPVAADESASSLAAIAAMTALKSADVFVLKPSLLGGIGETLEAVRLISGAGLKWVITSALDGAASRRMLFELVRALPVGGMFQGLSAGSPFIDEKESDGLEITSGRLQLREDRRDPARNTAF